MAMASAVSISSIRARAAATICADETFSMYQAPQELPAMIGVLDISAQPSMARP